MITRIRQNVIDPVAKIALTELQDDFGGKMIVQTSILGGDHEADVSAAITLMQSNEDAFIANLKSQFSMTDAQIDAMKGAK
jgi:hypothetical protein